MGMGLGGGGGGMGLGGGGMGRPLSRQSSLGGGGLGLSRQASLGGGGSNAALDLLAVLGAGSMTMHEVNDICNAAEIHHHRNGGEADYAATGKH